MQLTPAGIDSIRGELKLKGDDHSCVLTASHGARMGGNALNVQYLQSVTKDLKVGGEGELRFIDPEVTRITT